MPWCGEANQAKREIGETTPKGKRKWDESGVQVGERAVEERNVTDQNVPPNSCAQVTAACSEEHPGWARYHREDCTTISIGPVARSEMPHRRYSKQRSCRTCNSESHHAYIIPSQYLRRREKTGGLTCALVALQHQLSNAGVWIPELDPPITRAAEHPPSIRSECDAEDNVL